MLVVPNRLQKVNGWSCSSQLWQPRQLSCNCLSNSCSGDYEKERWQHTPLSESNTNGERSWVNFPDTDKLLSRNTMAWQPVTGGRQLWLPQHSQKLFTRNPVVCFLEVDKACGPLWHTSNISQKFAGEWNLVCSATAGTKTTHSTLVQLFCGIFFKALGNVNVKLIENFQKASRTAQKAVAGHMQPACLWPLLQNNEPD